MVGVSVGCRVGVRERVRLDEGRVSGAVGHYVAWWQLAEPLRTSALE